MAYIKFENVCKTYDMGEVKIEALKNTSFEVEKGEICIILGPSGAGKTTVLNILGGMDNCDGGSVSVDGREISGLKDRALTAYRREDVGFVFQFYNLIPNLTALENVEMASFINADSVPAADILERVGLGARLKNFPSQLSGGEQQRVAIARALAKNPKLLLCDEPTGALDYMTGKQILKLLQETAKNTGMTVVIITHNSALTGMGDRVVRLKNGTVSDISINPIPVSIDDIEW